MSSIASAAVAAPQQTTGVEASAGACSGDAAQRRPPRARDGNGRPRAAPDPGDRDAAARRVETRATSGCREASEDDRFTARSLATDWFISNGAVSFLKDILYRSRFFYFIYFCF